MNKTEVMYSMSVSRKSGPKDDRPYLPTVKAIVPNAPMGATRINMATTRKTAAVIASRITSSGLPRGPANESAKPKRREMKRTWRNLAAVKYAGQGGTTRSPQSAG
jgi:hypothetical protein